MPAGEGFLLVRVDDRLLHGQVALGWGGLNPRTFLLVDDRLHDDPVESEIYRAAAPDGTDVRVASVEGFLAGEGADGRDTFVLLRDLESLERLVAGGFGPMSVNLGGLHARAGAEEVLPYLFLRPRDWELLDSLSKKGVTFFAQDLPSRRQRDWSWLVRRRGLKADA